MIETAGCVLEIVEEIVACYKPDKVILFGPYYLGNITRNSDISLLLIKDTELSKNERSEEIYSHLSGTDHPVDLLVYTPDEYEKGIAIDDSFLHNMMKVSKLLYDKEAKVGKKK